MPGASSDARLAHLIAILGRSKRNSRKSPFYAPFLFFPVPVIASLFSALTSGASDLPEAAEATVSASDDARQRALNFRHHSIKGLAMYRVEYVPTSPPISSLHEKLLSTSPPNSTSDKAQRKAVPLVSAVRERVSLIARLVRNSRPSRLFKTLFSRTRSKITMVWFIENPIRLSSARTRFRSTSHCMIEEMHRMPSPP